MGITNTLSKLKEYFEAWHNSNYNALHIQTEDAITELRGLIAGLRTDVDNIINNTIPDIYQRLNDLDYRVTQGNHKHNATDINFSISNNERWQQLNSPANAQDALDELLDYTDDRFNQIKAIEVVSIKSDNFNPSVDWHLSAYVNFSSYGPLGICEYWIRSDSNTALQTNVEKDVCTIPLEYRPKSAKFVDTYNWGRNVTSMTDDGGVRVALTPEGRMMINSTRDGPVNTIGFMIYILNDDVYIPWDELVNQNGGN